MEPSDLNNHSIVYATDLPGYQPVAELLRRKIQEAFGIGLPVFADTEAPVSSAEILIGHTNRPLSDSCYRGDGAKRLMTYELIARDGSIQIACGGPHSAKFGGDALISALKNQDEAPNAWNVRRDLAPESVPVTPGADVRIMSANVLGECYRGKKANVYPLSTERSEILAKILVDYRPDLVGVQEMDLNFHAPMERYFQIIKEQYGVSYSILLAMHKGKNNDCPILYRADKYRLNKAKYREPTYEVDGYENQYPCGVSYARFTSLDDPGTKVAILSGHWHWEKEPASAVPRQQKDADLMASTVKRLERRNRGIHVFSTGDLNSHRFHGHYLKRFIGKIRGADAGEIAEANGVREPSFKHMGVYIDHIIGRAGTFDVLLYRGTQNHSEILTDHQPVFADIRFLKKENIG